MMQRVRHCEITYSNLMSVSRILRCWYTILKYILHLSVVGLGLLLARMRLTISSISASI